MLVILVAVAAVYWPALRADFVRWDDYKTVAANPDLNPPTFASLGRYWRQPYMDLYAPVTYTVWAGISAVVQAFAPDERGNASCPWAFHAASLLVHAASSLLVFGILLRMVGEYTHHPQADRSTGGSPVESRGTGGSPVNASSTGVPPVISAPWPALAGALLFAVHPLQVETVAWASGLKDLLAGMFGLVAVYSYLRHGLAARRIRPWYLLGTLALLAAMLSKPSAVVVPVIAAIIVWLATSENRPLHTATARRRRAAGLALWLALAVPIILRARQAQGAAALDFIPSITQRLLIAIDALAFYVGKLLFPWRLAMDYGRAPQWLLASWQRHVTWLVPVAIAALCWLLRRRWRGVAAGAATVFIALLPVLGLARFDFQYYSTVADHYMYLAMLGPAVALAWTLSRLGVGWALPTSWPAKPICAAAATILLLALAIRAHVQTYTWQDSRSLFAHTLAVNPASVAANYQTGKLLSDAGDERAAIPHFQAVLRIRPNDTDALLALGRALVLTDRPADALPHYETALRRLADSPRAHADYAAALYRAGQADRAIEEYRRAISLDPSCLPAHTGLGKVFQDREDFPAAVKEYEAALSIDPTRTDIRIALQKALDRRR